MSMIEEYKKVIGRLQENWDQTYSFPLNLSTTAKKQIATDLSTEKDVPKYIDELCLRVTDSYGNINILDSISDICSKNTAQSVRLTEQEKQQIKDDIFMSNNIEKVKDNWVEKIVTRLRKPNLLEKYFVLKTPGQSLEFDELYLEAVAVRKNEGNTSMFSVIECKASESFQLVAAFNDKACVTMNISKKVTLNSKSFDWESDCHVEFLCYYPKSY